MQSITFRKTYSVNRMILGSGDFFNLYLNHLKPPYRKPMPRQADNNYSSKSQSHFVKLTTGIRTFGSFLTFFRNECQPISSKRANQFSRTQRPTRFQKVLIDALVNPKRVRNFSVFIRQDIRSIIRSISTNYLW